MSFPSLYPSALRAHRSFLRFWWARLAGTLAQQMMLVALGWQMYDLTGSAWDLGLVGLAQFVPALLLALPAGQIIDRTDRRMVVGACLALQAAVAALLTLGTAQGWVSREAILALSVLLGAARAFQMPAQQAMTPALVPRQVLSGALAFSSAGAQGAIIAGPAVGGALYALGGAAVYACSAAGSVAGCALVASIARAVRAEHATPPGWGAMLAGLGFIFRRRAILGALSLDLFAVLLGGATALLPIFARDILHTGPQGLGLLRSAPAVGALLASIWLARHPIERRAGRTMLLAVGIYGVAMLAFGASRSFALSLAAIFVSGAADMVSVVVRQTLVQIDTPDEMRGRVAAVNSVFIGASNQLGEFESGATAAWLGPAGSVLLGGMGTLVVVAAWFKLFPELAQRDRLAEPVPDDRIAA